MAKSVEQFFKLDEGYGELSPPLKGARLWRRDGAELSVNGDGDIVNPRTLTLHRADIFDRPIRSMITERVRGGGSRISPEDLIGRTEPYKYG